MNIRSNYALTKLRLAKEDTEFASAKYNLEILPTQKLNLQEQAEAQRGQTMQITRRIRNCNKRRSYYP